MSARRALVFSCLVIVTACAPGQIDPEGTGGGKGDAEPTAAGDPSPGDGSHMGDTQEGLHEPAELRLLVSPGPISVGDCFAVTVDLLDEDAELLVEHDPLTLVFGVQVGGTVSAASDCSEGAPSLELELDNGVGSATLHLRGDTAGDLLVWAETAELYEELVVSLEPAATLPASLAIDVVDGARNQICVAITVTAFDDEGNELPPDSAYGITLDASGGTLHPTPDCTGTLGDEDGDSDIAYLHTPDLGPVTLTALAIGGASAERQLMIWQTSYHADDLSPHTLVVYNQNHPEAEGIATYYAGARAIPDEQLCPVEVPTGAYAHYLDVLGARRTIIEDCICPALLPALRPEPCDLSNIPAIANVSPFTHMVLVRGMPLRLQGTAWPSDVEDPAFGYYLSYLIYNPEEIFLTGTGLISPAYSLQFAFEHLIPPLEASQNRFLAYGHLQAMTAERTLGLIDRNLAAEAQGFRGNLLSETDRRRFRLLMGSTAPECYDYLTHSPFVFEDPASSWPHEVCRYGCTDTYVAGAATREIPGELDTTVPFPVRVGMFMGDNPWPQGHSAFDGFSVMRRWHREEAECTELCRDLPSMAEISACEASSTDYFRELNTDCVGGAPGFVGHQVRSFPVSYYGFIPPGWQKHWGGLGDFQPPVVITDGGFQNGRFTDSAYAHWGTFSVSEPDTSTCRREDGSVVACPEAIRINMSHMIDLPAPLPVSGSRSFEIKIRYRYRGGGGSSLALVLEAFAGGTYHEHIGTVDLSIARLTWTEAAVTLSVPQSELNNIEGLRLFVYAGWGQHLYGFFDFDGVELIDSQTGDQLFPIEVGSFAASDHDQTTGGDYAANVIDRLGGIGWFGSASHHLYGGWSWKNDLEIAGAFFAGRTLGEALVDRRAASGLFFGDPLYRPAAIKIYAADGTKIGRQPISNEFSQHVWLDWPTGLIEVRINGMLGTGALEEVRWWLDTCDGFDAEACAAWTPLFAARGAARGVSVPWMALLDPIAERDLTLRLTVARPDAPTEPLFDYAYFTVHPGPFVSCLGDVNHDFEVDPADYQLVRDHRQCTPEALALASFGGDDTTVDDADYNFFKVYFGQQDLRADLNGDGQLDPDDDILFQSLRCGLAPGPGLVCDLDGDGDIDDDDLAIVEANYGSCMGG